MDIKSVELDGGVLVTLSRRNLADLVAQAEKFGEAELHRMTPKGFFRIVVESNEAHYVGRTPGYGSGLADSETP
jgi:hypothetical protein